jgi:hypothetical protein
MVTVEGMDFRAALAQVERLAEEIGAIPGFRASVVDSPLDLAPRFAIQGRLADKQPPTSQARFSIKVSRATEVAS